VHIAERFGHVVVDRRQVFIFELLNYNLDKKRMKSNKQNRKKEKCHTSQNAGKVSPKVLSDI
jgi:hypothetical protein